MKPEIRATISQTLPDIKDNHEAKKRFFDILQTLSPCTVDQLLKDHDKHATCFYSFIIKHVAVADQQAFIYEALSQEPASLNLETNQLGYIKKAVIGIVQEILGSKYNASILDAWDTALNELMVMMINMKYGQVNYIKEA